MLDFVNPSSWDRFWWCVTLPLFTEGPVFNMARFLTVHSCEPGSRGFAGELTWVCSCVSVNASRICIGLVSEDSHKNAAGGAPFERRFGHAG